jgi:cytochrome c peroxidase
MRTFLFLIVGAFLAPFLVVAHYRQGEHLAVAATAAPAPKLPIGVSEVLYAISVPPRVAPTPERIRLGEKLFLDRRLSADDSVSCSTCHDPAKGFTDHRPQSQGIRKQVGQRNSPTVLNAMFNASQFWDGRAASLEEQAKLPILNPIEMGMKSPAEVVAKLKGLADYPPEFQRVFGRELNYDDLAAAIAAFERTKFSGDAPFDRFIHGEENAINASARRGWALFNGKGRCNDCHAGNVVSPLFSDQKFHNIGIAARSHDFLALAREAVRIVRGGDQKQIDELAIQTKFSEVGRFLVTKNENEVGAFKTPNLRNVGITGPYMHDGSLKTLWDVMDHYNKGGEPNPFLDGGMQRLGLSEAQIDDLVAFMFTLTDERFRELGQREQRRQTGLKGQRPQRDTAAATGKKGNLGDLAPDPDLKQKDPADLGLFGPGAVLEGAKK